MWSNLEQNSAEVSILSNSPSELGIGRLDTQRDPIDAYQIQNQKMQHASHKAGRPQYDHFIRYKTGDRIENLRASCISIAKPKDLDWI